MARITLLLFLLFITGYNACALKVSYTDSTQLEIKKFDNTKIATYRSNDEFDYKERTDNQGGLGGWFSYQWHRFWDRLLETKVGDVDVYDILLYGSIVFAAIMIVIQLFRVKVGGLFKREAGTFIPHKTETENIHEIDFDALITQAIEGSNYRLAIRMYYLKTLKNLSEQGLINWQKNKTNFEYYYELRDERTKKQFYALTLAFEYAWYGHAEITGEDFTKNRDSFNGFIQSLRR